MKPNQLIKQLKTIPSCTWINRNSLNPELQTELENLYLVEYRTHEYIPRWYPKGKGFKDAKVFKSEVRISHKILLDYKGFFIALTHPNEETLYAFEIGEQLIWSENCLFRIQLKAIGFKLLVPEAIKQAKARIDAILISRTKHQIKLF